MSYEDFPWFRQATVGQILNVELLHRDHLHWPEHLHRKGKLAPATINKLLQSLRKEETKKKLTIMTILCPSSTNALVQTRFLCDWNPVEDLLQNDGVNGQM